MDTIRKFTLQGQLKQLFIKIDIETRKFFRMNLLNQFEILICQNSYEV